LGERLGQELGSPGGFSCYYYYYYYYTFLNALDDEYCTLVLKQMDDGYKRKLGCVFPFEIKFPPNSPD